MQNLKSKNKNSGFTLIELLIVIVILGILAAALLSAINPLEQIRKSQDTSEKSDAAELLNAMERYFTTFQYYPSGDDADPDGDLSTTPATASSLANVEADLELTNEVKPEFFDRSNLDDLYVSLDTNDLVHICFEPASSTFTQLAVIGAHCPNVATACICVPSE